MRRTRHSLVGRGWRHALTLILLGMQLVACGDGARDELIDGDVALDTASYRGIDYNLTSDNYTRWLAANAALDSARIEPVVTLDPRSATDADIDSAIDALEDDERASSTIRGADISVRDYVLTSVALAQSWDAIDRPTRVTGVPTENVSFLRTRDTNTQVTRSRPVSRIIDYSGKRGKGKARGRGKGKSRGKG